MNRILITGSQTWTDRETIRRAMLVEQDAFATPATIVHGACPTGADKLADEIANEMGWPVEPHPADGERYGKSAESLRNVYMVRAGADVCLAFIVDASREATHCAFLAESMGIRLVAWERPS